MLGSSARGLAVGALLALLCACAKETVVLLPEKDGGPGALTVTKDEREVVLDQPYAAVQTRAVIGERTYASNAKEVADKFGPALGAQPSRPNSFTLYFVEGSDRLTEESNVVLKRVLADIAEHTVPDIVVIGHTDTVGNHAYNDALALRRAESLRSVLIAQGLPPAAVVAVGRGKREPLVPTADNVAEPRNRRVEIIVR
jgi:outer membrane protein OmpA-like peptidoglycan-associated protein